MLSRKRLICLFLVSFLLIALFPVQVLAGAADLEESPRVIELRERRTEPNTESEVLPFDVVPAFEGELDLLASPPATIASIFPDPALAAVIAEAFRTVDPLVTVNTTVNQGHLNAVIGLLANDRNIQNLQGMQFLNNLEWVELAGNRISNLQPLANLRNLEMLLLIDNHISYIGPLSGLTNLLDLELDFNNISNLQPLANLTRLEVLGLMDNNLSYIGPLSRLTRLEWLDLDANNISNLQPLANLTRLEILGLMDNNISNVQPLSGLTNLVLLELDFNFISNIQPLAGLTRLEILGISFNEISDLRPLSGMNRLQELYAEYQLIYLPPVVLRNPLTVEVPVFNIAGQRVPPSPGLISHDGVYQVPNVIWINLPGTPAETGWGFTNIVQIGSAVDVFSGVVVQPLVDSDTPFIDVPRHEWFHDAVYLVNSREYMTGTGANTYNPHGNLTRAMVAAILYRMEGRPAVTFRPIFVDVPATAADWYRDAVVWAADNGIVLGRPGNVFAPHDNITREEFAIMMYRFADMRGLLEPVPDSFSLAQFPDHASVSEWAFAQMRWAAYHQLIRGTPAGEIDPQGLTSRAACAVIIERFVERFEA